jgi:Skp family chaperone for outer membrane proteins
LSKRKKITTLYLILGLSIGMTLFNPAMAQQGSVKIAILDLEGIRRNAIAVKDIRAQLTEYRKGFQENIKKEEDALRSANKGLATKRTILGPEAFARERRLFEQKVIGVQKLVRKRKNDLDKALSKAMLVVEKKMNGIVADTASKRGASLVLQRQHTILSNRSMDMTAEVLERLNAELKTVKVDKPGSN